MNTLRLENINLHSPYLVGQTEGNKYSFYFDTDFGLRYTISFMLEYSFVQSGAYQFCINVEGDGRSPGDKKLRQTIFTIIEEFFEVNGSEAMLYLCCKIEEGAKINHSDPAPFFYLSIKPLRT